MKPRLIRCYRGFASVNGRFNIEVFYIVPDFGYSKKLFTCIHCGELFMIDLENPRFEGKTSEQIIGINVCPKCGHQLKDTIRPYPEHFRTEDGQIGSFEPNLIIPPDSESLVKEVFEIDCACLD